MTLFRTKPERERSRAERRAASIATPDLLPWAEQALDSLGRDLSMWRRTGDPVHVADAEVAAEALLAVVREMRSRTST